MRQRTALPDHLIVQWAGDLNGDLTPGDVSAGSGRKVWWRCERGHTWEAVIKNRTMHGSNCPYCGGQRVIVGETDLATTHPDIAAQWADDLNGHRTPRDISRGSAYRAWWRCAQGHTWQATPSQRTTHLSGCPYCAGNRVLPGETDMTTRWPDVAQQWAADLNGDLDPRQLSASSLVKVWWRCLEGHTWRTTPVSRTYHSTGCPECYRIDRTRKAVQ